MQSNNQYFLSLPNLFNRSLSTAIMKGVFMQIPLKESISNESY